MSIEEQLDLAALHSMHRGTMNALIDGDLPYKAIHDKEINEYLKSLRESNAAQIGGVYAIYFVDSHGLPPTIHEMQQVLAGVRAYLKDAEDCSPEELATILKVDQFRPELRTERDVARGRRKYVDEATGKGRSTSGKLNRPIFEERRTVSRRERVHQSADKFAGLLRQFSDIPRSSQDTMRFPRALVDIGWSQNMGSRFQQHYSHKSTNRLMGLYHALLGTLFTDKTAQPKYNMMFIPLVYVHDELQPEMTEIALTRLTDAYHTSGYGLNTCPAGRSNPVAKFAMSPSSSQPEDDMMEEQWQNLRTSLTTKNPHFQASAKMETQLVTARLEALQTKEKEYLEEQRERMAQGRRMIANRQGLEIAEQAKQEVTDYAELKESVTKACGVIQIAWQEHQQELVQQEMANVQLDRSPTDDQPPPK